MPRAFCVSCRHDACEKPNPTRSSEAPAIAAACAVAHPIEAMALSSPLKVHSVVPLSDPRDPEQAGAPVVAYAGKALSPSPNHFDAPSCLLTVPHVAELLAVSEKTIRRWIAAGRLPAVRFGRLVRVSMRSLEEFIQNSEDFE